MLVNFEHVTENLNSEDKKIIIQNDYTLFICSFDDLITILNIVKFNNITSKLYDVIPITLSDLILNRKWK
jgi:hypothetical protein